MLPSHWREPGMSVRRRPDATSGADAVASAPLSRENSVTYASMSTSFVSFEMIRAMSVSTDMTER